MNNDTETRTCRDAATRRHGHAETGRRGDTATYHTRASCSQKFSYPKCLRVAVSPRRGVSASPRLHFALLFLLALSIFLIPAEHLPTDARAATRTANSARVPFLFAGKAEEVAGKVTRVAAVGMTVSDMDASVAFYEKILSFEKVSDVELAGESYERLQGVFGLRMRIVRLRLGNEFIELTEYLAPKGRPAPVDSRSNDRWFQHIAIITSDMDKAYAWLRQNKVEHASTGPQRLPDWNKNAAGIKAFYFKDPDKHALEILQFPEGKGDAKWHHANGKLFLGIDHTAIVVSNTAASLEFYRDDLGLRIAGTSENYGTEQEHLNNVFGARLRITSLRADGGGPGIEFLEYLAPRDGRQFPTDAKANDLFHWQTTLVTTGVDTSSQNLSQKKYSFVSTNVIALTDTQLGYSKGVLVRDPDGHVMALVEN